MGREGKGKEGKERNGAYGMKGGAEGKEDVRER